MGKFVIDGGKRLCGEITAQSAKNAMLPLISACIMLETKVTFLNCDKLYDVLVMLEIIECLGGKYYFNGNDLVVDCSSLYSCELPCEQTKKIRASIFTVGPLISRFRKATLCLPGGCDIGERPIDMHVDCLKQLGVEVYEGDVVYFRADKLVGNEIRLKFKSVGVTENLIMASIFAKGKTTLKNCAEEPEIVCLANFLNGLGADVKGAGTDTITINGVKKLTKKDVVFSPISDRIEVGTFILATLTVGGEVQINNANYKHNYALIKKVLNNACKMTLFNDKIYIKSSGVGNSLNKVKIAPYPAFPTDLQSPLCAYATTLRGLTVVEEGVFENRFKQLNELSKMGANVKVSKNRAIIYGVKTLYGAKVTACDLRGGAAMIIAGLGAQGVTEIENAEIVERGYYLIENKLCKLGAKVKRE